MTDQTFNTIQAIELRQLLAKTQNNPVLATQLRRRLAAVEQAAAEDSQEGTFRATSIPRTAIFLRGGGVHESEGIRPNLAAEALIQYERMFIEQTLHYEREIAKEAGRSRRPKGSSTPGLLFTGTPRGSFGLEFVPLTPDDDALIPIQSQSLNTVSDSLTRITAIDPESTDDVIASIPSSVLKPMKLFMKALVKHGAELRLAFHDRDSVSFSPSQIAIAFDRLNQEVIEEQIVVPGTFRGITFHTGVFDLRTDSDDIISGSIAGELSENDMQRIHEFTNRPCQALLQKTTIQPVTGASRITYVLLDVRAPGSFQTSLFE
jgi:hypothetical protein